MRIADSMTPIEAAMHLTETHADPMHFIYRQLGANITGRHVRFWMAVRDLIQQENMLDLYN